jgi:SAM-dependent methyltransferase
MMLVPARSYEPELMDREGNSRAELEGALRDVRRVNRWLGGRRALRLALRPLLLDAPADRPFRVLDVGTGAADLPQAMVELGRRLGRVVEVTAVDLDPVTAQIAERRTRDEPRIRVLRADAFDLPFAAGAFDVATVSMFLHHFDEADVARLLSELCLRARRAVIVNDLRRHRLAWAAIWLLGHATGRHPIFIHDAPLSVLRGFTDDELRAVARASGAREIRLCRRWPYRLVMTLAGHGAA